MGLDMYLSKKTYVKNWSHNEVQHNVVVEKNGVRRTDIKPERVSYVVEEIAYWRKFNALHNYIVETHAKGVDECQEIYLQLSDLELIQETLKEVMKKEKSPSELFPTASGFFFGNTDYDEYYFGDVESTIMVLDEIIEEGHKSDEEHGIYGPEYVYRASW